MTDRIRHLTVVLDEDYRSDDVEAIVKAIQLIRGVASVDLHVVEAKDHLARSAVRDEIARDLHAAIDNVFQRKRLKRMIADADNKDRP